MCRPSPNLWVSHIHPFLKDKRKKLDSININNIFIGYNLSSKAYRIYIKEGRKIEVSRDVIFDENHAYKISKDIRIKSSEEHVPLFEEEEHQEKEPANQEEEEEETKKIRG